MRLSNKLFSSMEKPFSILLIIALPLFNTNDWITKQHPGYKLSFPESDQQNKKLYSNLVDEGLKAVKEFTGNSFQKEFLVKVHPSRSSLDSQWQKDWGMPDFKSECWMVASGVAIQLDLLSPIKWEAESCEHTYSNKLKTQQLLTHELFHVYHGH